MSLIQEALEKANKNVSADSVVEKNPPKAPRPKLTPQREVIQKQIERDEQLIKSVQKERVKEKPKKQLSGKVVLFILIGAFLALGAFWITQPAELNQSSSLGLGVGSSELEPAARVTKLGTTDGAKMATPKVKVSKVNEIKESAFISQATYQFSLTGITTLGEEKFALIDNQIVGVGDMLRDGIEVHSIENKSVILKGRGRQITLRL